LWCEADVTHDRNTGLSDTLDGWGQFLATLDLDAVYATLFNEPESRPDCLFWRNFIRPHGKISYLFVYQSASTFRIPDTSKATYEKGMLCASGHAPTMK
jgi:hypothetical protein